KFQAHLEKTENDILELSHNAVNLKSTYLELTELWHVLEKTQVFFTENQESFLLLLYQQEEANDSITRALINEEAQNPTASSRGRLEFVAGVINRERVPTFERMLWRISRGNVFLRQAELEKPLEDPATGNKIYKTAFVAFFQGEQLKSRIKKVCTGFHASLYPCPSSHIERQEMVKDVRIRLEDLNLKLCGSTIPSFLNIIQTNEDPPTFNRTNKFTKGFQTLIDAYGIASYREANPALYTIVTFPFLFGVMFGDAGHGVILTIFAACLILREKKIMEQKLENEIASIFFGGRYIILLMGIFSIYTGIIYNDVFAKSLNIFGSSWRNTYNFTVIKDHHSLTFDPATEAYQYSPYPLGVDPVWSLAENKILFLNSFKMKLSIIFGVVHMIFGVCMSVVNIMYTPGCAPSVLNTFINMMLFQHSKVEKNCFEFMFEGQEIMQMCFVFMALLCIPSNGNASQDIELQNTPSRSQATSVHQDHDNDFGEMMIYQAIHTIEYVLSTVSHTASYLRLWALSLAHSQLSEVLWNRVLRMGLGAKDGAYLNSVILMEFMSKFYKGEGHIFQPFYFKNILDAEDVED
ncbi:hypothetical protein M0802_012276, partial [Mischocyttarus mexicanus]